MVVCAIVSSFDISGCFFLSHIVFFFQISIYILDTTNRTNLNFKVLDHPQYNLLKKICLD